MASEDSTRILHNADNHAHSEAIALVDIPEEGATGQATQGPPFGPPQEPPHAPPQEPPHAPPLGPPQEPSYAPPQEPPLAPSQRSSQEPPLGPSQGPPQDHNNININVIDSNPPPKSKGKMKYKAGCYGARGGVFHQTWPEPKETNIIAYDEIQDRSCWCRIPKLCIRLNPIVTLLSVAIIWSFVAWCIIDPIGAGDVFGVWKVEISKKFSWLYIGSQDLWAIFVLMLYFSKYSQVKLGKDDDEPEYSDASWFAMLFACGVGIGLFFFGVSEPIWHYDPSGGGNRYIADGYMPDNTLAQWAINLTYYHWGVHAWIVYCIVGMLMGIVNYRLGLPMTVKSCFYPLLGDKIFGWIGDVIDATSIVTTIFGVCTSLGLGTMQLNTGLNMLNPIIEISSINQVIIIWCITAVATASTLSGIGLGIRRLSELCFTVGMVIMLVGLFLSNTWYILNLYVQSLGFYVQWIIQLGFHTDAFEQIGPSYGGTSRGRAYPDRDSDGPENWMDWWTIFYWGWWISWSPFVGMFIAKISKGRTIQQFINGTMTAPILYGFLWFAIFGGIGIQMEREAAGIGLCCTSNFNKTINSTSPLYADTIGDWVCLENTCNPCAVSILKLDNELYGNESFGFLDRLQKKNFGTALPNRSLTRLSCHSNTEMWFDVMNSYGDLGLFLSIISIVGLVLYFVTSSDSGSFVVDCMAANGDEEPPRIQRVFWAFTEGATATALLWAGGNDGLVALQTVSVAAGLPYTFVLCFMCISLWRALAVDAGDINPYGPQFAVDLFDVFARPTCKSIGMIILNIIIAPYSFAKAIVHVDDGKRKKCKTAFCTIGLYILLIGFVALHVAVIWIKELWALAWVLYIGFTFAGGVARIGIRNAYGINGNMIEDIFCSLIMYPFTAYQLSETVDFFITRNVEKKKSPHKDIPMDELGEKNLAYNNSRCNASF